MLNPMAWGLGGTPFHPQPCFDPVTLAAIASMAATAAPYVGTAATVAGTAMSYMGQRAAAKGTIAAGQAAKQAADYEAAQLDIKANEERAAARVEADEFLRRKELALSSGQAKGAASGFTSTDPSSLAIADEISRYGTVQEQMALYGGESRAEGTKAQAAGRRFEGNAALQGAGLKAKGQKLEAAGTILGGISTLASRFAPASTTSSSDSAFRFGQPMKGPGGWRTTTTAYR